MLVECQTCDATIREDEAIVVSQEEGEVLYFCCEECVDEYDQVTLEIDLDVEERATL